MVDFVTDGMADALRRIADVVDRSESDPDEMVEMLREIKEVAQIGIDAYLMERERVQNAEIAELRRFKLENDPR